ncbi:MAG: L-seryl-tRNA(Sec) selenium transferase [Chloroflexi bacterium]|nr:L-seryl-tRNA(Sec) selenium transferase [Chloroflexota bacterium]
MTQAFRNLPSVERLLQATEVQALTASLPREVVTDLVRGRIDEARAAIGNGADAPTAEALAAAVVESAEAFTRLRPRGVINATGVIIHTNLGRAPLSAAALAAVRRVAEGYSDLEYALPSGERGSRRVHAETLLTQLTGAEAALAVNNNAAAVLLALATVASGREVIVSRGEAVEIGGGFRVPDVLAQSGAKLVEVGTTNRTYAADFEHAITEETAAILSVHASNFKVVGFTSAPSIAELAEVAHRRNLPLLHDLGSGCLLDTAAYGMAHEPMPQESIAAGADLALFSGDKLLGGPQCGVAVGRAAVIERMAAHPLARAFRIDKLSLAALTATLMHYVKGEAVDTVPVWAMISTTMEDLQERAINWSHTLGHRGEVVSGQSTVGGGSLPGETLPTCLLALDAAGVTGGAPELARRLRTGAAPVVARVQDDRVLLDPRTVSVDDDPALLQAVALALKGD